MKILMQQADAAGAGAAAGAAAAAGGAAGGAGTGGNQNGQQQAGQQQGASSSQAGTQKEGTTDGKSTDASKATAKADGQAEIAIKLPDGVKPDQAVLDSFKEMAKKGPLTPQGVVDFWLNMSAKSYEAREKQRLANVEAIKADPEFGGPKYDQTVADARSFVAEFGGEDASKEFVAAGVDTSPAIVKMLARARQLISEDKLVKGRQAAAADDADAIGRKTFPASWDAMKKIAPKRA